MIQLFQYTPHWNLPNISPFCMKVETFLKMTQIPYQSVILNDPRKSPKKKLPFIQDEGETIGDSSLILDHLMKKYALPMDANLTEFQKGISLSMQRLMEEHLYWAIVYSRWIEAKGWEQVKACYFSELPSLLRHVVSAKARSSVKKALFGQGLGRHSREEVYRFAIQDLEVLNSQLENNTYLIGSDRPTSIDATGYAFIANILQVPIESPARDYVHQHVCFERYCNDMHELYFSDASYCVEDSE